MKTPNKKKIIGRLFRIPPKKMKKFSNFKLKDGKLLADYRLDKEEIKVWKNVKGWFKKITS